MAQISIYDFIKANGDPFETLQIPKTSCRKTIKSAYKDLAIKYHPDKNPKTKELFIKIKKAYEYIMNHFTEIEKYIDHQQFRQQEYNKMSKEQKIFADDLVRREQQAEKVKQQEDIIKKMKVQEELNHLEEQRKIQEQKQHQTKQRLLQFELENQDAYKKLNTIKVKWGKDELYTKELLELVFKSYGAIQNITIKENKNKATITFHTTEAANNAFLQGNDETLSIKFGMKENKRKQLQEFLRTSKEKLNRNNDDIYNLSSDTLKRISHFYTKDQKVVQDEVRDLEREQERLRIIKQIYEDELN